jgi:hypothetical protein
MNKGALLIDKDFFFLEFLADDIDDAIDYIFATDEDEEAVNIRGGYYDT